MAKVIKLEHVRGPVVGPGTIGGTTGASIPSGQVCTVLDFKPTKRLSMDGQMTPGSGSEVAVWAHEDDNDEYGRGTIDPMVYLIAGYTVFFGLLAWLVT